MKMLTRLTIALLWLGTGIAHAQPATAVATSQGKGLRAGFQLGLNVGTMDYGSYDGRFEWDARLALAASAFLLIPVHPSIAVQPELSYHQKGTLFDSTSYSGRLELDYLEVGLLGNYTIPTSNGVKTYFVAGPTLGFLVKAETTTTYQGVTNSHDAKDEFEGLELGVVGGAGVRFGAVILDVRYQVGLTNVDDADVGNDDAAVHTRNLSMTLGYLF